MGTGILSTGDKVLNAMKEMDMSMAGIREADISTLCQIADALGVCVRELCPDEERYSVPVEKNTLAKLIVVSEINGVELDVLIASILEKGIEENGFYD